MSGWNARGHGHEARKGASQKLCGIIDSCPFDVERTKTILVGPNEARSKVKAPQIEDFLRTTLIRVAKEQFALTSHRPRSAMPPSRRASTERTRFARLRVRLAMPASSALRLTS